MNPICSHPFLRHKIWPAFDILMSFTLPRAWFPLKVALNIWFPSYFGLWKPLKLQKIIGCSPQVSIDIGDSQVVVLWSSSIVEISGGYVKGWDRTKRYEITLGHSQPPKEMINTVWRIRDFLNIWHIMITNIYKSTAYVRTYSYRLYRWLYVHINCMAHPQLTEELEEYLEFAEKTHATRQ